MLEEIVLLIMPGVIVLYFVAKYFYEKYYDND